jgi:hypothetical protein
MMQTALAAWSLLGGGWGLLGSAPALVWGLVRGRPLGWTWTIMSWLLNWGWQGGLGALVAGRLASLVLGWGASTLESEVGTHFLILVTKVGTLGLGLGALLLIGAISLYRRRAPNVIAVLLLVLALAWLYVMYAAPYEEARHKVAVQRAVLTRDWNKDCRDKGHFSLQFTANCADTEAALAQDDVEVARARAIDMMLGRLWSMASLAILGIMGIVVCFGAAQQWSLHVEKKSYRQRRGPDQQQVQ